MTKGHSFRNECPSHFRLDAGYVESPPAVTSSADDTVPPSTETESSAVCRVSGVSNRTETSFETPGGHLRVGAYLDPHDRTATAGLTISF